MIEERGIGKKTVNYKLRDWVFSRQRYWGEPIPIIHCPHCGNVPVPEDQLPLTLPEVESYQPTGTGESPLAAIDEWVNTTCPVCGAPARRETNTMPQWAGSSWYFLRYVDSHNEKELVSREKADKYLPVDMYIGGVEHAVLHLLYSRSVSYTHLDVYKRQGYRRVRPPLTTQKSACCGRRSGSCPRTSPRSPEPVSW